MKVTNFSVSRKNKLFVNQFTYMFSNNYIYNLYGPNGSGKSTFAKALAGYLPYGGESEFKTSTIGIVSSYTNIPGEVSVKSVIQLLDHQTDLPKNIRLILYQRCGINSIIDRRHVSLLSDGEKRKLMIFSVLNRKKDVLILDEFTSGLDRSSGKDIRSFIVHLQEIFGFICINITHTLEDARYFSGQILYLDPEQKEIIEIASVAELAEYL